MSAKRDTGFLNKNSNSVGFSVEVTLLVQFNSHVNLNLQRYLMALAVYRAANLYVILYCLRC
jgi:hypothetical protein